jgi:WxcM-like, C-terminal
MTNAANKSGGILTRPIAGVEVYPLKAHRGTGGELTALEEDCNLGFPLRRVFYIRADSAKTVRAEHASSAEMVLIALAGAVTVDVDNGSQKEAVRLDDGSYALSIRPGVWVRLRGFAPGTLLLVASSRLYAETHHYDTPQPALIHGH